MREDDKHMEKAKLKKMLLLSPLYLIFFLLFLAIYPMVYIIKEKGREKIKIKIALVVMYILVVLAAIFVPVAFWIFMGLFGALAIWLTVWTIKDECIIRTSLGGWEKRERRERTNPVGNIFNGLSVLEAKKLYRRLIRKYHPDNPGGNAEYTKKITTDYMAYTKQ